MKEFPPPPLPVVEVGLAAAALGSVAAVLILLPVISIPLSAIGLLCGTVGVIAAWRGYPNSLRAAIAGFVLCCITLGTGVLINFAPRSETPGRSIIPLWEPPPGRPSVPPPASVSKQRLVAPDIR
jgi:hypothetical protein